MLRSLSIKNYAVISDLEIRFQSGLNMLTGETGAGKSIILGALGTILGDRIDTTVLRAGAAKGIIEGEFDLHVTPDVTRYLAARDLAETSDYVFLRREIYQNGRTRAFVNDTPVQLSVLQDIAELLVDLHGQHEHQSLLRQQSHLTFIDAFGGFEQTVSQVNEAHARLKTLQEKLAALVSRQTSLSEKREFLVFQMNEINKVRPEVDEAQQLLADEKLLQHSERLHSLTNELVAIIYETSSSLFDQMGQVEVGLRELARIDARFTENLDETLTAKLTFDEMAKSLQAYRANIEFNPNRLEEIQTRLSELAGLKKKYSRDIAGILAYREDIRIELEGIENLAQEIAETEILVEEQRQEFARLCLHLSSNRKTAAGALAERVPKVLSYLGMPGARFSVALEYQDDPNGDVEVQGQKVRSVPGGIDFASFLLSSNAGEDLKPLSKVASGGEISRVMLALKSALAKDGQIPVLVFDEIDIGVSGRIARAVGRKLGELAKFHQVICITHLPQIASMGDHHFLVEKTDVDGRTATQIRQLDDGEREIAIARLLAGDDVSEAHLKSARELLEDAFAH